MKKLLCFLGIHIKDKNLEVKNVDIWARSVTIGNPVQICPYCLKVIK